MPTRGYGGQKVKSPRVGWAISQTHPHPEALVHAVYRKDSAAPGGGSRADRKQRHRAHAARREAANQRDLARGELSAGLVRALPAPPQRQLYLSALWD